MPSEDLIFSPTDRYSLKLYKFYIFKKKRKEIELIKKNKKFM